MTKRRLIASKFCCRDGFFGKSNPNAVWTTNPPPAIAYPLGLGNAGPSATRRQKIEPVLLLRLEGTDVSDQVFDLLVAQLTAKSLHYGPSVFFNAVLDVLGSLCIRQVGLNFGIC